jgi:hypothetical protein
MVSPTGIVPERLIHAGMKPALLDYLRAQPWPGDYKLQVLHGWAKWTGSTISAAEDTSIAATGWK